MALKPTGKIVEFCDHIKSEVRYWLSSAQVAPPDKRAFDAAKRAYESGGHIPNPYHPGTDGDLSWRKGLAEARRQEMLW